tara:strand:- start:659 stop:1249 length:591 start_codon:yes stop_codon:yes gene_type:complete
MAFKMKGPSLLKMVKQMRENSPMKKDGEGTAITRGLKKIRKDLKKDRSPAKQDLGSLQTNRNKEEAAKSLGQTIEENKNIKKTRLGDKVDAMSKKENTQTGDLDYKGGNFDEAFADAKKSGARVFTHNGKKYTTQTKKEKEMDDALVKIPKKKIQPLPTKTDAELKGPEDRPDPTFEGTDEFRSLDEIRADSKKNK